MSNVGDALSGGGSDATGVSDTSGGSFGDTPNLTNSDFNGMTDADIMGGGSSSAGPSEFSQVSDVANALSGGSAGVGANPTAIQSASMTPPAAAGQTGGDPTGAAGGTQSNATPGATPDDKQQQGGGKQQQNDPNYAPPQAVSQLKALLKQLNSGKPAGPTGPTPTGGQAAPFALPTLAAMRTGVNNVVGAQPAGASLEGGPAGMGPGPAGTEPGGDKDIRTALPTGGAPDDFDPATGKWAGRTAAGTPADQTPLPPPRPPGLGAGGAPAQTADAGGRQITVKKPGAGAQPSVDLPTVVPPGSAAHPLPTHKPGASPAPSPAPGPATSSILRDISGVSTGSPTALADLAQAAKTILPLVMPLLGGLMGGGRRGGRFHGGRFTHGPGGGFSGFRGGMNAMGHLHQGQHPMARGAWPYHHPVHGWHFHGSHPGQGWLPLNPSDAQGIVGGGQQGQGDPSQQGGPDPNAPPKETGADVGTPDSVGTSGAIPGVGAKEVNDYTRSVANKWGINPDIASKILAQESSYGQARKPGDNGTSFGPFQLHFAPDGRAMGDDFRRDTGLDPRDPKTWKDQVDYAMKRAAMGGWAPWTTTMKKLGLDQWSGITTNRRFAGQLGPTRQDPSPGVRRADAMPVTPSLPPSSQPMVGG